LFLDTDVGVSVVDGIGEVIVVALVHQVLDKDFSKILKLGYFISLLSRTA